MRAGEQAEAQSSTNGTKDGERLLSVGSAAAARGTSMRQGGACLLSGQQKNRYAARPPPFSTGECGSGCEVSVGGRFGSCCTSQ